MGIISKVKSAVKSAVSKVSTTVSKAYTSVDKNVFKGALPSGSPSQSSKSSSSSSSSSSKSSSGGGSSTSSPSRITGGGGSYNVKTQTYTDSSGNKMSMSIDNALKSGATIDFSTSKIKTSSGGMSIAPKQSLSQQNFNKQVEINKKNREIEIRNKGPSGVVSAYVPPTKQQIAESQKLAKEYQSYKRRQTAGKIYDKAVEPIMELFEGVDYLVRGKAGQEAKREQDKLALKGKWSYKDELGAKYQTHSTREVTNIRPWTDEELLDFSHGGTDELINRKTRKANVEVDKIVEEKQNQAMKEMEEKVKNYAESKTNEYTNKYNSGKMDYNSANSNLQRDVENYANKIAEEYNTKVLREVEPKIEVINNRLMKDAEDIYKKKRLRTAKSEILQRTATGFIIGAGLSLMGPVGVVVGGLSVGKAVKDSPKIIQAFKYDWKASTVETLPLFVGAFAGAKTMRTLKGQGNARVVKKVTKLPKDLKLKGSHTYSKDWVTKNIPKLQEIVKENQKMITQTTGGKLRVDFIKEGLTHAIRQGKNWYENIIQTKDGTTYSTVQRTFGSNKYYIRTVILKNGARTVKIFKGDKVIGTFKDNIKGTYGLTEAKDLFNIKLQGKGNLPQMKVAKAVLKAKAKYQDMMNRVKGTHKIKGKVLHQSGQTEITIADPLEFQKWMRIAIETGDKKLLKILKEAKLKRAKFGGKGMPKNYIDVQPIKIAVDESGRVISVQKATQIKTPNVKINVKQIQETDFYAEYTKYPSRTKAVVEKLVETQKQLIKDKRGELRLFRPDQQFKIPQIRIKTTDLRLTSRYQHLLELPMQINIPQLKYLMMLGAISSTSLMNVLANKNNIKTMQVSVPKTMLSTSQRALQMQKQAQALVSAMKSVQVQRPLVTTPQIKIGSPEITMPPFEPKLPTVFIPSIDSPNKKPDVGDKGLYKEQLKRLAWVDPMFVLTGKSRYSGRMNIDLTKRYGSFST